eukprot:GHVT01001822.1.p1 GENE.GHVT01001822.1~~GHVT01001822.1.p1  ORF type:complete len:642 (-),score=169.62 GHVT01001822.1:323-2248(-)
MGPPTAINPCSEDRSSCASFSSSTSPSTSSSPASSFASAAPSTSFQFPAAPQSSIRFARQRSRSWSSHSGRPSAAASNCFSSSSSASASSSPSGHGASECSKSWGGSPAHPPTARRLSMGWQGKTLVVPLSVTATPVNLSYAVNAGAVSMPTPPDIQDYTCPRARALPMLTARAVMNRNDVQCDGEVTMRLPVASSSSPSSSSSSSSPSFFASPSPSSSSPSSSSSSSAGLRFAASGARAADHSRPDLVGNNRGGRTKPKILIIITGGTMCMDYVGLESSLRPCPLEDRLRSLVELRDPSLPAYDIIEWAALVDSSDMGPLEWTKLAKIIEKNYAPYDGFVILHGTDTMAYTASALSFMLENLAKPVVMTGSMLPMVHISTDAKRNLAVSMMVAAYANINEVVVVFGSAIMRGNRCTKKDCSQIDAFDTPNFPPLGRVGVEIRVDEKLLLPLPSGPLLAFCDFHLHIVVLSIAPGFPIELLRVLSAASPLRNEANKSTPAGPKPLAVILQLYGSGTAPGDPHLLEAIHQGVSEGLIFAAVTQCHAGTVNLLAYENGAWLSQIGVINCKDMTVECCFAKLAYLMGLGVSGNNLKQVMEADICGEVTQSPSHLGRSPQAVRDILHSPYFLLPRSLSPKHGAAV